MPPRTFCANQERDHLPRCDDYIFLAAVESNPVACAGHHQRARALRFAVSGGGDGEYFTAGQIENVQFAVVTKTKTMSANTKVGAINANRRIRNQESFIAGAHVRRIPGSINHASDHVTVTAKTHGGSITHL